MGIKKLTTLYANRWLNGLNMSGMDQDQINQSRQYDMSTEEAVDIIGIDAQVLLYKTEGFPSTYAQFMSAKQKVSAKMAELEQQICADLDAIAVDPNHTITTPEDFMKCNGVEEFQAILKANMEENMECLGDLTTYAARCADEGKPPIIVVAFDGVPPLCKVVNQKARRMAEKTSNHILCSDPWMLSAQYYHEFFQRHFPACQIRLTLGEKGEGEHIMVQKVSLAVKELMGSRLYCNTPNVLLFSGDSDILVMGAVLQLSSTPGCEVKCMIRNNMASLLLDVEEILSLGCSTSKIEIYSADQLRNQHPRMARSNAYKLPDTGSTSHPFMPRFVMAEASWPEIQNRLYQLLQSLALGNDFLPTYNANTSGLIYDPDVHFELDPLTVVDPKKVVDDFLALQHTEGRFQFYSKKFNNLSTPRAVSSRYLDPLTSHRNGSDRGMERNEMYATRPCAAMRHAYAMMIWYCVAYYYSCANAGLSSLVASLPWYYGYITAPNDLLGGNLYEPISYGMLCSFNTMAGYEITPLSHYMFLIGGRHEPDGKHPDCIWYPKRINNPRHPDYMPICSDHLRCTESYSLFVRAAGQQHMSNDNEVRFSILRNFLMGQI